MTHRPQRARAAAVLVTAAALLAACSSAADDGRTKAAAPSASATKTSATPAPGTSAPAEADPKTPTGNTGNTGNTTSATTATPEPPKIPKSELTPVTGTFTKKEKAYLADRVPVGTDPAAILQTGQETCDKLGYLAKVDRAVAVESIRTGEIPDPEDAVKNLCPEHQDLLDAAEGDK